MVYSYPNTLENRYLDLKQEDGAVGHTGILVSDN